MMKKLRTSNHCGASFQRISSFVAFALCMSVLMGQTYNIAFSGADLDGLSVSLDKVVITDLNQNWSDTIYFPDTTFVLTNSTGVTDIGGIAPFSVTPATPNPFMGTTCLRVQGVTPGFVTVKVTNQVGALVASAQLLCDESGELPLRVTLNTSGLHVFAAIQNGRVVSTKLLNVGNGGSNTIESEGGLWGQTPVKIGTGYERFSSQHPVAPNDRMRFVGYTTREGEEVASASVEMLLASCQTVELPFAFTNNGLPCEGTPTVTDVDGNVYNTVRIGTQCWMKENLRTTHLANGDTILFKTNTHGHAMYRYAPNNDTANVPLFGYLYNWHAATWGFNGCAPHQGACPTGWHVPTTDELNQLFNHVRGMNIYHCDGNPNSYNKAMSDSIGWTPKTYACSAGYEPATNNATGFSLRPAGYYNCTDEYYSFGNAAHLWSSTEVPAGSAASVTAYSRYVENLPMFPSPDNYYSDIDTGLSVRCLKD